MNIANDGQVQVMLHVFTTFMKDFYGSYALMFVIFLLAMRVTVILFNVITGNGLHLGGYIGSVDKTNVRNGDDYKQYKGFKNRHLRYGKGWWTWNG